MTSDRVYHAGKSARQALKELLGARGTKYDTMAIDALVTLIGAYPVGTRVRLNTGERGQVVEPNYDDPTRPTVEIDTHGQGKRIAIPYQIILNEGPSYVVSAEW